MTKKTRNEQTSILKSPFLFLQEIKASWIVGQKEGVDETNQPMDKRMVNRNRIFGKTMEHIENVNYGASTESKADTNTHEV